MPRAVIPHVPADPEVTLPDAEPIQAATPDLPPTSAVQGRSPQDMESLNLEAAEQFLAAQARGETESPDERENAQIIRTSQETEAGIAVLVRKHLLAEAKRQEQVRQNMLRGIRPDPVTVQHYSQGLDRSVPMFNNGRCAIKSGYAGRWVRMIDARERPSSMQAGAYSRHGYRAVTDPETGKPLVSEFGMWMECPLAGEAARQAEHAQAVVPLDRKEAELHDVVDRANSELGQRAITVIRGEEHRMISRAE